MIFTTKDNGDDYLCDQLLIRPGAELTFRINTEVENYGDLNIKGTVFVLNPIPGTFRNLLGGKITIENGGRLEFNN